MPNAADNKINHLARSMTKGSYPEYNKKTKMIIHDDR
jgi:hypothetical protein